tara:strand:+ start:1739 stop:2242 length:504 start_codon:yes stop_codon:yes gene_type:complete
MTSLFNIAKEFQALEELLHLDGGEITEAHEELEKYVSDLLVSKTDSYVEFVQKLEAEIEMAADRLRKIQSFKKARENAIERLKNYAHDCLQKMDKQKITGDFGSISIRKPTPVLLIEDEMKIPEEFCHYERKIDNAKLKAALKDESIDGARLIDGKKSVMIKLKGVE